METDTPSRHAERRPSIRWEADQTPYRTTVSGHSRSATPLRTSASLENFQSRFGNEKLLEIISLHSIHFYYYYCCYYYYCETVIKMISCTIQTAKMDEITF